MCEFIYYKYKPKVLDYIDYNYKLKKYLISLSNTNLCNLVLYGSSGTCKKTLLNFSKLVKKNRLDVNKLFTKLKSQGKKIVALSTPAKGMTLLNYCKLDRDYLEYATEKSKLKINKFTPGGSIPIYSDKKILQNPPDYALILAWNFSKEIIRNNQKFLKKGGKFIIPIPKVKIIDKL